MTTNTQTSEPTNAMDASSKLKQLMKEPSVIGFVQCSEEGDIIAQEGNDVDVLSTVLVYFQQIANLIGDSFGLENYQEAQIQGQSLTVITSPYGEGVVGIIVNSKLKINEVARMLREAIA